VKSRTLRVLAGLSAIGLVLLLGIIYAFLAAYVYLAPSLPSSEGMRTLPQQVPLRVYTRSGALISQIGEQRRVPVSYEEIPELVREAFLAAEDDRFFQHGGIDYFSALRSIYVDLTTGDYSQGASTITMQTARNMFLTRDKNITRKLQEIFVTLRMEHSFTKQEILETYLNVIFFGQRAYGVAAAAEVYFGKPLSRLSVAEAAMLAGLPQAPSRYNPVTNPQRAAERRRYVLQRMLSLRYIDADTAHRAMSEPINAHEYAPRFDVEAPYMAEIARQIVVARFGDAAVNAGYRAFTTIDGRLQTAANRALRLGLIEYDRRHGYRGVIRRVRLDAGAEPRDFETLLNDIAPVGNLQAAVVASVAPAAARVYVRGGAFAQIDWDGVSWARGSAPAGKVDSVLRRGDVVYVVSDDAGHAQLAQVPAVQGALVALDPHDGAVVALVGGFDYFSNAWNHVTQARRQPGSGFKPFLYSCALEHDFTPASIIMDAPVVMTDGGAEQVWRPKNDSGTFSGPTRLREALVHARHRHRHGARLRHALRVRPLDHARQPHPRARHAARDPARGRHRLCRLRQRRLQGRPLFHRAHRGCPGQDRLARRAARSVRELHGRRPGHGPEPDRRPGRGHRSACGLRSARARCDRRGPATGSLAARSHIAAGTAQHEPAHDGAAAGVAARAPVGRHAPRAAHHQRSQRLADGQHHGGRDQARHRHPRPRAGARGHQRQDRHQQ
jgi:penicillin-binding protein 1A